MIGPAASQRPRFTDPPALSSPPADALRTLHRGDSMRSFASRGVAGGRWEGIGARRCLGERIDHDETALCLVGAPATSALEANSAQASRLPPTTNRGPSPRRVASGAKRDEPFAASALVEGATLRGMHRRGTPSRPPCLVSPSETATRSCRRRGCREAKPGRGRSWRGFRRWRRVRGRRRLPRLRGRRSCRWPCPCRRQ